jgi:hypothetical protein
MATSSGFFNAEMKNGSYDRTYLAEDFAACMRGLVTDGVIAKNLSSSTALKVTAGEAGTMNVKVAPGRAWIEGYWFENSSEVTLTLEPPDPVYSRFDGIMLRLDYVTREITFRVSTGYPTSTGSAHDIQRDEEAWEIELATITVEPTDQDITDTTIFDNRASRFSCGLSKTVVNANNSLYPCTQEEYDSLQRDGGIDPDILYVIGNWE